MKPGRYELVFNNGCDVESEICGGFAVSSSGMVVNIWGDLTSRLEEGSEISNPDTVFTLSLVLNGYFAIRRSERVE